MKALTLCSFLAGALVIGSPGMASAQPASDVLPRADAWGSFGWAFDSTPQDNDYRTSGNRRLIAGAGAAVYWAPHFKFEVDTSTKSRGVFSHVEDFTGAVNAFRYSRVEYERWGVALVQTYEFLQNAWFTPYAGAGADIIHQTREEYIQPVTIFDPITRQTKVVQQEEEIGPEHRTIVRPLAAFGFKAYMSRHAFFRGETRLAFDGGVDEVRIRFGFGVDF